MIIILITGTFVSAGIYDNCEIYGNCEPVATQTGNSFSGKFTDLDFTGTTGFNDLIDNTSTGGGGLSATNPPYLYDDTVTIFFNETKLNQSIQTKGDELYYLLSNPFNFYNSSTIPSFILTSNEANLNVNSSNYWDNINTTNSTQFQNNAGILSIIPSWLTSFINSWFSTQTTDNLNQGTNNLYDNRSWNESHADSKYYLQTNPQNYINSTSNIFDQSLNTTENVTFGGLNITGESLFSGTSTFDGSVLFNGEVDGTETAFFSAGSGATYTITPGSTQFLKTGHNGFLMSSTTGWIADCDGSITKLSANAIQTGLSGVKICYELEINNVNVYNTCSTDMAIPPIGYTEKTRTQARNIDTFTEGDLVTMRLRNAGTADGTVKKISMIARGYCDN